MPFRTSIRQFATILPLLFTPALAQYGALTYVGCYKSANGLTQAEATYAYQSSGHCQGVCISSHSSAPVLGLTNGNSCYCGTETPGSGDKVSNSSCNSPCTGYGQDDCGGIGFYSIYLTGTETSVGSAANSSSSSTSSVTSATSTTAGGSASIVTSVAPGRTVVVTQSASASQSVTTASAKKAGTSIAPIAAGVVVGIVVIFAVLGGAFFCLRHRKKQRIEEMQKQHQVSEFMARKGTVSSQKTAGPDPRFDTEAMAHRRLSDGSIADNEDYSRRILKITNPDDGR